MATYFVRGFRENTAGNVADAGPFEVYLNTESASSKAGTGGVDLKVHNPYDVDDSYLATNTVNGVGYTNTITKAQLNAGIGLTTTTGFQFIFRSVSNCTNNFIFIPPSPTPSRTPTLTPTATVTPSRTPSISITRTVTPSRTPSTSITPSNTPSTSVTPSISISATPSQTPGATSTPSVTPSRTPSTSITPSISITPSVTGTPGATSTPSKSITPSNTPPVSPTRTPSNTPPVTPSRTPSNTPPSTPPASPTRTPSVSATRTPSISVTPSRTPPISPTPSRSDPNLTSFAVGYASTLAAACSNAESGPGSWSTIYHDGSSNVPTTGDRFYSNSSGTSIASSGYYASILDDGNGADAFIVNSSGYVSSTTNCNFCVVEGTMIATSATSSVAVENLEVGDNVYSKNIPTMVDSDDIDTLVLWSNNSISGSNVPAQVISNNQGSSTDLYQFNFDGGNLTTTANHVHIVKRNGTWIMSRASDVVVGDKFEKVDGSETNILSINTLSSLQAIRKLNVEVDDVYYANGILTHNIK